jgi:hypothetical protein
MTEHTTNSETGGSEGAATGTARSEAAERTGTTPQQDRPREIGGRGGLDPVRYGDWEKDGRCIDF